VKSLNKHVTYQNRQQFLEDYKELSQPNISEEVYEDLIAELSIFESKSNMT